MAGFQPKNPEARAYATHDGTETLIATMSGTLMALAARA